MTQYNMGTTVVQVRTQLFNILNGSVITSMNLRKSDYSEFCRVNSCSDVAGPILNPAPIHVFINLTEKIDLELGRQFGKCR